MKDDIESKDLEIDLKGNVVEINDKFPFEVGGSLKILMYYA